MVRRRIPPLNALSAFESVAEHGSLTAAARSRGVTQPSISRHIALLEDWMGVTLFERQANALRLSPEGEEFSGTVRDAFDQIELAVRRLQERRAAPLVVGCSVAMAHLWLLPQLASLRLRHPDADLSIFSSENYADFDRPGIDLSIRFAATKTLKRPARMLVAEGVAPVASKDFAARHGLTRDAELTDLDPAWLLHHTRGTYGWLTWPLCFELSGLAYPGRGRPIAFNNYPLLIDRTIAGEGVLLGHAGAIDQFLENGALVPVGPIFKRAGYGFHLLESDPPTDKHRIGAIATWLLQQGRHSGRVFAKLSAARAKRG